MLKAIKNLIMSIIKHNHQVSCHLCISNFNYSMSMLHCGVSYVAYIMFHMLHEMMSIMVIKKLCDFIYMNLPKQVKFC
jgi:hypothetical protein